MKTYWVTYSWCEAYIREAENGEATLTIYTKTPYGRLYHMKTYKTVKAAKAAMTRICEE